MSDPCAPASSTKVGLSDAFSLVEHLSLAGLQLTGTEAGTTGSLEAGRSASMDFAAEVGLLLEEQATGCRSMGEVKEEDVPEAGYFPIGFVEEIQKSLEEILSTEATKGLLTRQGPAMGPPPVVQWGGQGQASTEPLWHGAPQHDGGVITSTAFSSWQQGGAHPGAASAWPQWNGRVAAAWQQCYGGAEFVASWPQSSEGVPVATWQHGHGGVPIHTGSPAGGAAWQQGHGVESAASSWQQGHGVDVAGRGAWLQGHAGESAGDVAWQQQQQFQGDRSTGAWQHERDSTAAWQQCYGGESTRQQQLHHAASAAAYQEEESTWQQQLHHAASTAVYQEDESASHRSRYGASLDANNEGPAAAQQEGLASHSGAASGCDAAIWFNSEGGWHLGAGSGGSQNPPGNGDDREGWRRDVGQEDGPAGQRQWQRQGGREGSGEASSHGSQSFERPALPPRYDAAAPRDQPRSWNVYARAWIPQSRVQAEDPGRERTSARAEQRRALEALRERPLFGASSQGQTPARRRSVDVRRGAGDALRSRPSTVRAPRAPRSPLRAGRWRRSPARFGGSAGEVPLFGCGKRHEAQSPRRTSSKGRSRSLRRATARRAEERPQLRHPRIPSRSGRGGRAPDSSQRSAKRWRARRATSSFQRGPTPPLKRSEALGEPWVRERRRSASRGSTPSLSRGDCDVGAAAELDPACVTAD